MEAVTTALVQDFRTWKKLNNIKDMANLEEAVEQYLQIKFGLETDDNISIEDLVKAFSSPKVEDSMISNAVSDNILACRNEIEDSEEERSKRSTLGIGSSKSFLMQLIVHVYIFQFSLNVNAKMCKF